MLGTSRYVQSQAAGGNQDQQGIHILGFETGKQLLLYRMPLVFHPIKGKKTE